ncbi:MAG: glycosyltransferase [Patescibacteria group bacterium]
MKLVVGFITYNEASAKYLADFLPSLKKALSFLAPNEFRVFAFDNSDQDNNLNRDALESFNGVDSGFIEYLQSGSNIGFSRAYNIMIRAAKRLNAEYFLMLNPDTLLETDTISELVSAMEKDLELASVSPKIRRWDFAANTKTRIVDSCGLVLKRGLRFADLGQGGEDDKRYDKFSILGPSGAAGLYRLSALEKIKENEQYFDERFFMYKEDCDLAYRLFLRGAKSSLVPTAIIYHDRTAAAANGGVIKKIFERGKKSRQIRAWSFRNQHLIFVKHWSVQNLASKITIIFQVFLFFIFSLILEQFLLKEYSEVGRLNKVLTNVK